MKLRIVLAIFLVGGCAGYTQPGTGAGDGATLTLRVATYNIHHGRGMDGSVDLERIASELRLLDPDIVALQEVDDGVARSDRVDQTRRLGELLGMNHAFGSFMDYQGGRYGMAILTRCAIQGVQPVRLTEGNEPRIALAVELGEPGGSALTVVNVHFDWVGDDGFRFAQASEVAEFLDALDGPYILAGDFNDEPGSRTLSLFHERAKEAAKPGDRRLTFPSADPVKEIDFIFASPADAWSVESVGVVNEPMASDHRPVIAELRLRMAEQTGELCAA